MSDFLSQAKAWQSKYDSGIRIRKPKQDFEATIKDDFKHAEGIEELVAALQKVGARLEAKKTRTAKEELELVRLKFEMNKRLSELRLHQKIIADKVKHFQDLFLPMYESRLREVKNKWDGLFKYALQYLDVAPKGDPKAERVKKYMNEYNLLPTSEQQDIEVKARYYIDFKNILGYKG